jgi:hypothetical protein
MSDFRSFLEKVFYSERAIGLSSIYFPSLRADDLNRFFIQEIAGRDSIAAFYKYITEHPKKHDGVILSVAMAPTEYGNLDYLVKSVETAVNIAKSNALEVVFSASKDIHLWKKLVGKNVLRHSLKYGFFTPCILCHLYFHMLRAFIAIDVGASPIVSGERALHGRKTKLNQTHEAVSAFERVFLEAGIEIVFPVIDVSSESELMELLPRRWEEGKEQLSCIFSGSSTVEGEADIKLIEGNYTKFLEEVAVPLGSEVIFSYKQNRTY